MLVASVVINNEEILIIINCVQNTQRWIIFISFLVALFFGIPQASLMETHSEKHSLHCSLPPA